MVGYSNAYFAPFSGWVARLVSLQDDSVHHQQEWSIVVGELALHPHWKGSRRFDYRGFEGLSADVFFRCAASDYIAYLRKLEIGTYLIVDGEICDRVVPKPLKHLDTLCLINALVTDPSGGAVSPRAARLYTSDMMEFEELATAAAR